MTIKELEKIIKDNFVDKENNINISGLDFSGYNVDLSYMKANNINQSFQRTENDLWQDNQKVGGDLWQGNSKALNIFQCGNSADNEIHQDLNECNTMYYDVKNVKIKINVEEYKYNE